MLNKDFYNNQEMVWCNNLELLRRENSFTRNCIQKQPTTTRCQRMNYDQSEDDKERTTCTTANQKRMKNVQQPTKRE